MKAYLIRVGIDQKSGAWNAPINKVTNEFAYVPIPEDEDKGDKLLRQGYAESYCQFQCPCRKVGRELRTRLLKSKPHLDPDFRYLTYGDEHNKAKQLNNAELAEGDALVFYAGLKSISSLPNETHDLVYALIGLYILAGPGIKATCLPQKYWHRNAHTRRVPQSDDIVFSAKEGVSGRLERCIPIGACIEGRYWLKQCLFDLWGGFRFAHKKEVTRLYLQLSGALPQFRNPDRFYDWFNRERTRLQIGLIQRNN